MLPSLRGCFKRHRLSYPALNDPPYPPFKRGEPDQSPPFEGGLRGIVALATYSQTFQTSSNADGYPSRITLI
jgi:hypothetical protein